MYNHDTRGRLIVVNFSDFSLVRVVSEDVSVRDAFVLARELREEDFRVNASAQGGWNWSFWLLPHEDALPADFVFGKSDFPSGAMQWQDGRTDISVDDDVDSFSWGDELDDDDDRDVHGFAYALWADEGGPRDWYPTD